MRAGGDKIMEFQNYSKRRRIYPQKSS